MLDFAYRLTTAPDSVSEADRHALRRAGVSARDVFDIAEVAASCSYTNCMASALEMMPNPECHAMDRNPALRVPEGRRLRR